MYMCIYVYLATDHFNITLYITTCTCVYTCTYHFNITLYITICVYITIVTIPRLLYHGYHPYISIHNYSY